MRRSSIVVALSLAAFSVASASAQTSEQPEPEEIVVRGIPNGARVVEVDFEKVWRRCAECKRALAKLELLAKSYQEEMALAAIMGGSAAPVSTIGTFQRSSANLGPHTISGLARSHPSATAGIVYDHMYRKHVVPERMKSIAHIQSFLDQLTPHVVAATEKERVERGARASLIGKPGAKTNAKRLIRTDVTADVIKRLDDMAFKIELPEPSGSGTAKGDAPAR